MTAPVIDLGALAALEGFIIQGDAAYDFAGYSVSSAGDVNGDGIDDLIVGAPRNDSGGDSSGAAYVIYGVSGESRGTVDLSNLSASQGFVIQGAAEGDQAGVSVSSAGDVNGDGIDDVIVGANQSDSGGIGSGAAYVIYGALGTTRGTLDLSSLSAAQGFIIKGDAENDFAGTSVSSAGDVNGDGIDDLVVGAQKGDDGGELAGEAYVIYGALGATRGALDLSDLNLAQGFIIQGDAAGDLAGFSVSSAGDVNGDGIDDIFIGAYESGAGAGAAYVIYGVTEATRGTIDLSNLSSADGFIIQGDTDGDDAGYSVSSAGDINGDGIDDLIVGAPRNSSGGSVAGAAYVVYGVLGTTRGALDLTTLSETQGFIIQGDAAADRAGNSVSAAGDVNGDGIDDLIVGAPRGDDGGDRAGEAYVIYGTSGFSRGRVDLTGLSAEDGFIIQGAAANDYAGFSVSAAGDVNGDGFADLIVGAYGSDGGGTNAGEAYVIYGFSSAVAVELIGTNLDETLSGGALDDTINGMGGNDLINGGAGADNLDGGDGIDTLDYSRARGAVAVSLLAGTGTSGEANGDTVVNFERVIGSAFNDTIIGDIADNLLIGGAGDDTLLGGLGADVLIGGAGADSLDGGGGVDGVSYAASSAGVVVDLMAGTAAGGDAAGDVLSGIENLIGSAFNDSLTGTDASNILNGGDGDDTLSGGAGDDTLLGGLGADVLIGGAGVDNVSYAASAASVVIDLTAGTAAGGDAAGDVLSGIENLIGSAFNDSLRGTSANNVLNGGQGDDTLSGGDGADSLDGGDGIDTLDYSRATSAIAVSLMTGMGTFGEADGDRVINFERVVGSVFADTLVGGAGDDTLTGGVGGDSLDGGGGIDTLNYAHAVSAVAVSLLSGTGTFGEAAGDIVINFERIEGSAFADSLAGGILNDTLYGGSGHDLLSADAGHDQLFGGAGNDTVFGGAGLDLLYGDAGNDQIYGDEGDDVLFGGTGHDLLDGDAGNDVIRGGEGNDSLFGGIGRDLLYGDVGSDLLYGGTGNDNLSGGTKNDLLYGDEGSDLIHGGEGNDSLFGGSDNDTLCGEAGDDLLYGGDGNDRLDGGSGRDQLHGDDGRDLMYGGADRDRLFGGDERDRLYGDAGEDLLYGGDGDDDLFGGLDDDRLFGDAGDDQLSGSEGDDRLEGGAGLDHLYGDDGRDSFWGGADRDRLFGGADRDLLYGGDGNDDLFGGTDHDRLFGDAGNDLLYGGAGNDMLVGGLGHDTLTGGWDSDIFVFNAALGADNVDRITDFNSEDDTIYLDDAVFTGLLAGTLAQEAFGANLTGNATTADHRIVYDAETGRLFFDADGSDIGTGIHFATVGRYLTLSESDFFVF